MDDLGLVPPAICVVLDCGCGDGGSGASNGEILFAGLEGPDVQAILRPVPFIEGDPVPGEAWRLALAVLDDAFEGDAPLDALPLFERVVADEIAAARGRRMAASAPSSPFGVQRYFEALGAIALGRTRAAYAGQLAFEWNAIASADERRQYRFEVSRSLRPWQLDLRQAVRDVVFEVVGGEPAARVAARFQNTIAAATADLVRGVACERGRFPVVLAGSCFENAGLARRVRSALTPDFQVRLAR